MHVSQTGAPGPVVKVEDINGAPTFTVNGEPFLTPVFETYVPETRYFRQFSLAGTKVFSFNANAARCDYGHSRPPTWPAPNRWDYSGLDERVSRVLEANPDALIMPRVYIGTPDWWLEQNPDELLVLDNGSRLYTSGNTFPKDRPYPSIASKKWRRDMGVGLRHLLEHVQRSDYAEHIFGYFLSGLNTEEWYHWSSGIDQLSDYSKPMTTAFQEWLRRKYTSVENLRRAWNDNSVTFQTVRIPTRDERYGKNTDTFRNPSEKMNVIDYYVFYNEIVPETIDYFAAVAKEVTKGAKVIGAFYAYMYEFRGDPEYGHNALAKLNQSEHLDFIFVTASYGERQLGTGGDYLRAPALSAMLHGKLWYHDNDTCSFLARKVMRHMPDHLVERHLKVLGATDTAMETIYIYRRSAAFALCGGFFESFFDLHGGYFDDPDLMAEVRRLNGMFERASQHDRGSCSEILIVSDENSCSYCSFANEMLARSLLDTQWRLIKLGAPADHVLIDDLELVDMSRYRFVVFLNAYNLTDRQRHIIDTQVKVDGRTVMWCYAPGYFNETESSVKAMWALTGMQIESSTNDTSIAPEIDLSVGEGPLTSALGELARDIVGIPNVRCQLFSVSDPEVVRLGCLPGTEKITFAMKDMGSWKSLYAITPVLPARLYRELARQAGVHIYNEQDDTLYANRSYVSFHANGAGVRKLKLPAPTNVYDAISEEIVATNADEVTFDVENGETVILRVEEARVRRCDYE